MLLNCNHEGLWSFVDTTLQASPTLHLSFQPDRYSTLGLTYNKEISYISDAIFSFQDQPITPMQSINKNRYLAIPIGNEHQVSNFLDIADKLFDDLKI